MAETHVITITAEINQAKNQVVKMDIKGIHLNFQKIQITLLTIIQISV